jgi:tight adherence protein B
MLAVLAVMGLVAVAGAQDEGASLAIRAVDSTDPSEAVMEFVYTGDESDTQQLTLTENGEQIDPSSVGPVSRQKATAFVIDVSKPMADGNALVPAKEAIASWIEDNPNELYALYAAGARPGLVQDFTSNERLLLEALDTRLGPQQGVAGGAIWQAIQTAGASLGALDDDVQPNLVVVAGSNDPTENAPVAAARGSVVSAGATTFVAAYTGGGMSPAPFQQLVEFTGGTVSSTEDGLSMDDSVGVADTVINDQQYEVTFPSNVAALESVEEERDGQIVVIQPNRAADLQLTIGETTAGAQVVLGGVAQGKQSLQPTTVDDSFGIGALQGTLGMLLIVVVGLAAAGLLAYAITSLVVKDDGLTSILSEYSGEGGDALDQADEGLGQSALVKRAVEITGQVAESQGYLAKAEASLERADVPLRPAEALLFYVGIIVGSTLLALLLTRNLIFGLVIGLLAVMIPPAVLNFKASRRKKKFTSLLPDTLSLLSGTLRAGYSLQQGVDAVSTEVEDPMGVELRRVMTESRLGRGLEEALEDTAERMDSPDFAWAVMAIRIQREVGGNLAELLMTVAETMVARERLRRDVASLTAEGRVSAIVLGLLPVGLGFAMWAMNPKYINTLFTDPLGIGLLVLAGVGMLVGFLWMKKIINIEI